MIDVNEFCKEILLRIYIKIIGEKSGGLSKSLRPVSIVFGQI